jgi:hypothetical protein
MKNLGGVGIGARHGLCALVGVLALSCGQGSRESISKQRDAVCGNGTCEAGENATNCAGDCFSINLCGDGMCEAGEQLSCPDDCGDVWFPIGPAPIDQTVTSDPLGFVPSVAAGRATVIAVNPQNSADLWLGTAGGGVWHSTSAGQPVKDSKGQLAADPGWTPVTDDQPSLAIGSITLANCSASRCNLILIGTGEASIRRQTYYGAGLIVGEWMNGTETTQAHYEFSAVATEHFRFGSIQDLRYVPADNSVYVAVASGVTGSPSGDTKIAPEPLGQYGLHHCLLSGTDDPATPQDERCTRILDMPSPDGEAGLPDDLEFGAQRFYLGVYDRGILRSDPNSDGHWCYLNPGITQHSSCTTDPRPSTAPAGTDPLPDPTTQSFDHVEIALGKESTDPNTQVLYAAFGTCKDNRTLAFCDPLVFRSADSGISWKKLPPMPTVPPMPTPTNPLITDFGAAYSRYTHVLVTHPANDDILFYGGVAAIIESTDRGTTFNDLSAGMVHGDQQDFAIVTAADRAAQDAAFRSACMSDAACNACRTDPTPLSTCTHDQLCLRTSSPIPTDCPVRNLSKDLYYSANDGGLYFGEFTPGTTTGTWLSANTNLVTAQLFGIGAAVTDQSKPPASPAGAVPPPVIYAGVQDNGPVEFQGTSKWHLIDSGDGGDATVTKDGHLVTSIYDSFFLGTNSVRGPRKDLARTFVDPTDPTMMRMVGPSDSLSCSFYQPFAVVPPTGASGGFYYSTDRVWTGAGFSTPGATAVSPPFASTQSSGTIPPDSGRSDGVITALAVSSEATPRLWVGLYNGQLWVSNNGPSTVLTQWTQVATGSMPKQPISHIELDPANSKHGWVSFDGFEPTTAQVWTTSDVTSTTNWQALGGLPPKNPVKVVKLDTRDGTTLWAGTDQGLFRMAGGAWEKKGTFGLPNVPVYDIEFDTVGNRAFVATHGRGAWMQTTKPQVSTAEGWVNGDIWDIPVSGTGFACATPPCSCQMEVLLQDGTVCAGPSSLDADNPSGTIQVLKDPNGPGNVLGTSGTSATPSYWDKKVVAWACRSGFCLPTSGTTRVPISVCRMDPNNKISAVKVSCDGNDAVLVPVRGAPQLSRPPSSVLYVDPPGPPMPLKLGPQDLGKQSALASSPRKAAPSDGQNTAQDQLTSGFRFTIVPTLLASSNNGGERALCGARVELTGSEDADAVNQILANAINSSAACQSASVTAIADPSTAGHPDQEDQFPNRGRLEVIPPPASVGTQIVLAVRAEPGESTDFCFALDELGNAALGQLTILQTQFVTGASGALGGTIAISEASRIGICANEIATTPGQTAADIAAAVEAAFMTAPKPGPTTCRASQNPRDIERAAASDSVVSVLASRLRVCIHDAGVGVRIGPEGVPIAPPVAVCKDKTVNADSACHGRVTLADIDGGSFDPDGPAPTCTLDSTGPFGLGAHTVTLTCTDSTGLSAQCPATVTVNDTTPPTLTCPAGVAVTCTSASGATAAFSATATDNCGSVPAPTCMRASGGTFALGATADSCSVTDTHGNSSSCSFYVTVALGDNPVCCPAGTNVILGTSNNDTLTGGTGRDCILGRGGQDTINGNGGNDIISGGDGDDIISGGAGDDMIFAGTGQDIVHGDTGNDFITGGDGDDQCYGGDGNDVVLGGQGQDRLFGENGLDTLAGEAGDDQLDGGNDNDLLIGGGLHDVCVGGPGTDTFQTCQTQTQ